MKNLPNKKTTASWEETHSFGQALAQQLLPGSVLALCGDLGSGKTTLIRGLAEGMGISTPSMVCSPTFSLLNIYPTQPPLYHFDLYRLPCAEEFFRAGFDEFLQDEGICCIEWAEKIASHLPISTLFLHFSYVGADVRAIEIRRSATS